MIFGIDDAIGAVMAGVGGFLGANKQKSQLENFKLTTPQYETPAAAQQDFNTQEGQLKNVAGLLGSANDLDNAQIQKNIEQQDPEAEASTEAASQLAANRAQGGLASDTVAAIGRANAYAALQGGFAGSSMADTALNFKTDQARLNAVNQAPQLNQEAMGMSEELSPVNSDVGATLIDPSALLERNDQEQSYNNDIVNQQRLATLGANVGNQAAQATGVTTGIAGMTGGINKLMSPGMSGQGWGFGQGDTGPTSDANFTSSGAWTGGWP